MINLSSTGTLPQIANQIGAVIRTIQTKLTTGFGSTTDLFAKKFPRNFQKLTETRKNKRISLFDDNEPKRILSRSSIGCAKSSVLRGSREKPKVKDLRSFDNFGEILRELLPDLKDLDKIFDKFVTGYCEGLIITKGNRAIGLLIYWPSETGVFVTHLNTSPIHRGKGIEKQLIQYLLENVCFKGKKMILCLPGSVGGLMSESDMTALGFTAKHKVQMRLGLEGLHVPSVEDLPLPEGYSITIWDNAYFEKVALLRLASFAPVSRGTFTTQRENEDYLRSVIESDDFIDKNSFVLEYNNQVIGYVLFSRKPNNILYGADLAIEPSHQGQGLATVFLWRAASSFRDSGFTAVELHTTIESEKAFKLYQKMGFEIIDRSEIYLINKPLIF